MGYADQVCYMCLMSCFLSTYSQGHFFYCDRLLKKAVKTSFYFIHKTAAHYWAFCTQQAQQPPKHSKLVVMIMMMFGPGS